MPDRVTKPIAPDSPSTSSRVRRPWWKEDWPELLACAMIVAGTLNWWFGWVRL